MGTGVIQGVRGAGLLSTRRDVLRFAAGLTAGTALALSGSWAGRQVFAQDGSPAAGEGIEAYPEVVYTGVEYQFDGPAEFASGLTRVTFQNNGQMDHHVMMFKFNDGKSMADLPAAFEQGLPGLFSIGTSIGGPGSIGGGITTTVIQDVPAGNYVFLCLIPDEDGIPHAAKGMALPVTVTQGTSTATPPTADGTIELVDFHFMGLPESVPAGRYIWEVKNSGQQLHEIVIYKNAPGVTFEQVQAILMASEATPAAEMGDMDHSGTPMAAQVEGSPAAAQGAPFVGVNGWAPAFPGASGWMIADLEAGDYFAICFVPDPASGAPHFALGMIQQLTVS